MKELEKVTDIMEDFTCKEGWLVCKLCTRVGNAIVTRYLERNNHFKAISYLRKVEKALNTWEARVEFYLDTKVYQGDPEDLFELIITTRNNFSLLHKIQGKWHKSLDYLLQAIKITVHLAESTNPEIIKSIARTYLNTSAIYYEIKKYDSSIHYANECLVHLKHELELRQNAVQEEDQACVDFYLRSFVPETDEFEHVSEDTQHAVRDEGLYEAFTTIVLVYYNIGVSYEALKNLQNANYHYYKGYVLSRALLRPENQIRKLINDVYQKFKLILKNHQEEYVDNMDIDDKLKDWRERTNETNSIKNTALDINNSETYQNQKDTFGKKDTRDTFDKKDTLNLKENLRDQDPKDKEYSMNANSNVRTSVNAPNRSGDKRMSLTNSIPNHSSLAKSNASHTNMNHTGVNFGANLAGPTHEQRLFRTATRTNKRPKSAVRFDFDLNVSSNMNNLNSKLNKIVKKSMNKWNLHEITNVEVKMFNKFLKSYGMSGTVDMK